MAHSLLTQLPSMDSLIAALKAHETGSFSSAATALGITHAAVSRRVDVVENWAGLRIFDRHARGVSVTPDGQRILARIRSALEQIQMSTNRRQSPLAVPLVRLAVTPSFARFWLLPRLKQLEGSPQDLRIEVVADLKHADIMGGEVDLAIRYGRGGWKTAHERKLFDEPQCPVVLPGFLPMHSEIAASELMTQPILHAGDTTIWRAWAHANGVPFKQKSNDRILGDYSLALEAARAGLGVALWNKRLHTLDDVGGTLRALEHLDVLSPLSFYLLSRDLPTHAPPTLLAQRICNVG